jgi:uncharacterized integral membrane protein (TIGR00698 family)
MNAAMIPTVPARPDSSGGWRAWRDRLPGLLLVAGVAGAAIELAEVGWLRAHGISALTLAIVLGMIVGNTFYARIARVGASGVSFSKQTLLRAGIILYGLRLTFQDIAAVGIAGVTIDALVLSSTFLLACWAGVRLFGLDRRTAMLIGAGSSICGAAAVMAAEPVVGGRAEQVTVAVSTVVVFGTLAIFLYPALYHLNAHHPLFAMSPTAYGLFAGSTIHEVAQVVAAGRAIADSAANTAVIAKMVRVMMLAPFLVLVSYYLSSLAQRDAAAASDAPQRVGGIVVPWFAVGFIGVTALSSLIALPKAVVGVAINLDTVILAMAMAALGVTTHLSAIRTAGLKPLALGALLFAWLIGGGLAINAGVSKLFGL